MIIKGKNDFYEGWLARMFSRPVNMQYSKEWFEGWRKADEADAVSFGRMRRLIEGKYIKVEREDKA